MKACVNHPTRLTHLRRIKCFGAVRRGGWDLEMYVRWRRLLSESQHHRIIRFGRQQQSLNQPPDYRKWERQLFSVLPSDSKYSHCLSFPVLTSDKAHGRCEGCWRELLVYEDQAQGISIVSHSTTYLGQGVINFQKLKKQPVCLRNKTTLNIMYFLQLFGSSQDFYSTWNNLPKH